MPSQQPTSLSKKLSVHLLALILLQVSTVLFPAISAEAEVRYVKPSSEAVVRRGQGREYKIIAMVKDGTSVEFIEENEGFAKILLKNGKEGWILSRFLSTEPPLDELVVSLRSQKEEILQRELKTNQQLDILSTSLTSTNKELDLTKNERNQILSKYKKLQQATADVVKIKNNMQRISLENKTLTQQMDLLKQTNETLRSDYAVKWFLTGGGVLILGMFIGGIARGSKKRKPSLL